MKLIFATNNKHKLDEIRNAVTDWHVPVEILSLKELGCQEEIPETADTLEGNALQKARYVFEKYGFDCFADDTGLEVEALDGGPGVYSARYAGEGCSFDDNIRKLLEVMKGVSNRKATFRTVICLLKNGEERYFEGKVQGQILESRKGSQGFGYDPVFQPDGYPVTFAEMALEEKNQISHRGEALRKLLQHLKTE